MVYNKTVSKTIGFKTRDLRFFRVRNVQVGKVAEVVNKACDCCHYLSLETLSYQSSLSCHTRYVC